jgi:hypothetical protein
MKKIILLIIYITSISFGCTNVLEITIKDHVFIPNKITTFSDCKTKIIIHNQDDTPEEFESHDFNREKIVAPNAKANVILPPMKVGVYKFFGEFHEETAQGTLEVLDR